MSFVSTGEMTRKAQREGYAVPAFNAENLEMAQAIIQAASREGSPVILQTTLPTARYWGMEEAVAVTASLAQEAPVPVALHLDHSNSFDEVMRAARAGYTSLMFDGSAMPYEENLRLTAAVSIGTVKKVYAAVVSPAQNLLRGIAGLPALQIRHPASNGHLAELQPAAAHSSVLHYDILLISFRFTRLPAASVSFCVPAWCNAAPPRDAAGSSRRPAGRAAPGRKWSAWRT